MGRHLSILFDTHFTRDTEEIMKDGVVEKVNTVTCNINNCGHKWTKPLGERIFISAVKSHMLSKHNDVWVQYVVLPHDSTSNVSPITSPLSAPTTPPPSKRVKHSNTSIVTATSVDAYRLQMVAAFITQCNLPLRIVQHPAFRAMCDALIASTTPMTITMPAIRQQILTDHDTLKQMLYTRLIDEHTFVTLAFDGWTNINGVKVVNVMAVAKGVAYFIKSIPNPSDLNTADWLSDHIIPVIDEMIAAGIHVNAIVTDNGSAETRARSQLSSKYGIISIPCAAHTVQLIVKRIMKRNGVYKSIAFFTGIINKYVSTMLLDGTPRCLC
jgi:hypothetical protein